jgi:hypothetical protein
VTSIAVRLWLLRGALEVVESAAVSFAVKVMSSSSLALGNSMPYVDIDSRRLRNGAGPQAIHFTFHARTRCMEAPNARQFRPFVMNISYHEFTWRLKLSVAEVETLDAAKIPIRQQCHRNEPVGNVPVGENVTTARADGANVANESHYWIIPQVTGRARGSQAGA